MTQTWSSVFGGSAVSSARALLGGELTHGGVTVRLTEVEAYAGELDPASHAYRGRTPRNAVMFGPPGYAYVYFVFGMHWCINVVCGVTGSASAVLLRAGEVTDGIEIARRQRPGAKRDAELARGPGCLTLALGIDGTLTGTSLIDGTGPATLMLPAKPVKASLIERGPRVGVTGGHDEPWRFWLSGDPTVSCYRRHVPRRRTPSTYSQPDTR